MRNILCAIITILSIHCSWGQLISGTVTDNTGEPLPGVTIVVSGTSRGATTNFDGEYSINASSGEILRFTYIGMKAKTVTVGNQSVINIVLEEDSEQLDEVIVTAFGISQEKKALGYAAQSIDAEAITQTKQTNIVNALQGQVAGVQITNSGGAPGQSARIIIRGINSLDLRRTTNHYS